MEKILAVIAMFLDYIYFRYSKRQDKLRAEKEKEEKRDAVKPEFNLIRQAPTFEEFILWNRYKRNPTDSTDYLLVDAIMKDKLDLVLENLTNNKAINLSVSIPINNNFIKYNHQFANSDKLEKKLYINTKTKEGLIVKDYVNDFVLNLSYSDILGNRYAQVITCKDYDCLLSKPTLIKIA